MTTILTVQDLHKRFGNRVVLNGVSFAVGDRDRIGLIGANGSGKSTLLKMIVRGAGVSESEAALLEPDQGQVTWRRDLVLEYVAQEPRLDEAATIRATLARVGGDPRLRDRDGRGCAAAAAARVHDRHAVDRRAPARRARAGAARQAGRARARRADQPPRRPDRRVARGPARAVARRADRRDPRSLLPRPGRDPDLRDRSRPGSTPTTATTPSS